MKIPASMSDKPEAVRVASILNGLDKNPPGAEVFEAFEQLDDLPADVVRAVLVSLTGPAPDPEQLDAVTRRAHGFPAPPLLLRCTSASSPKAVEELNRIEQEQLRRAGTAWDGLDLPTSARLAKDGSEATFAGALELKSFADADGTVSFDVVLHGEGSGAIFKGGTSEVIGAVAYGVVELSDKLSRVGVQAVLASKPDPAAEARVKAAARAKAEAQAEADATARAEADARAKADAKAEASSNAQAEATFSEQEPTTQKRVKKGPAAKRTAVKKVAAKKTAVEKVAAEKAAAPKKVAAKKTAAKKTAAKKTVAKKTAAKKTAAKKTAAPKKVAAKKTAAPKTAAAAKKAAAPATKKTAAPKKTAAKKTL